MTPARWTALLVVAWTAALTLLHTWLNPTSSATFRVGYLPVT